MKTEAHRIALECYEENSPVDWPWVTHLHKQKTPGELLAWAIINVEMYAPVGTSQELLIDAGKELLKLLYH